MSPVQIIRLAALALVAGGAALGLVPSGPCGSGWLTLPAGTDELHGWFVMGEAPDLVMVTCGAAMAPAGSWAIALIVIGAVLLVGARLNAPSRPRTPEP
ncbi:hypothetical protein H4W79_005098 [Nocardiopsis terrae]|uniref:MYXO-CTERM domain-containing protein n=1 Tax=Nocardiopsis terrae TaxID=372655 RepID=A0ABR9HPD4_9ACTN|nr:hypothetical protein [Nocardiopsis terrae]MBE1460884.1 hypothetical protein [Nocardiopsis terrae]